MGKTAEEEAARLKAERESLEAARLKAEEEARLRAEEEALRLQAEAEEAARLKAKEEADKNWLQRAVDTEGRARALEGEGREAEALEQFNQSAKLFLMAKKNTKNANVQKMVRDRCDAVTRHRDELWEAMAQKKLSEAGDGGDVASVATPIVPVASEVAEPTSGTAARAHAMADGW